MKRILTAENRNGAAVHAARLEYAAGLRAALGADLAFATPGVYQIVSTQAAYISGAGAAGPAAGSTYLAPGLPLHLIFRAGDVLRSQSAGGEGSLFAVPLATE